MASGLGARRQLLLMLGAGGHARACREVVEAEGRFSVLGYVGQREEMNAAVGDLRVVGADCDLERLRADAGQAHIGIGQLGLGSTRRRLFELVQSHGFELPTLVSPQAFVAPSASLGAGTIVMPGAIVHTEARIGENCILNSRALIEHEAVVGDHVHVATGAILNGSVQVGSLSMIGSGTCIREGVSVGPSSFVGMGLSITESLPENTRLTLRAES